MSIPRVIVDRENSKVNEKAYIPGSLLTSKEGTIVLVLNNTVSYSLKDHPDYFSGVILRGSCPNNNIGYTCTYRKDFFFPFVGNITLKTEE